MNRQYVLSIGLAHTLLTCYEGSSSSPLWQGAHAPSLAPGDQKEAWGRSLSLADQLNAAYIM